MASSAHGHYSRVTAATIRALEDGPVNPFTGREWPAGHDALLARRRALPVYKKFDEILSMYQNNQVISMTSETGSGKTTQVPPLILHNELASKKIATCTQIKKLATVRAATTAAEEMGVVLGEEVGYRVRFDSKINLRDDKKTQLIYMTEGIPRRVEDAAPTSLKARMDGSKA